MYIRKHTEKWVHLTVVVLGFGKEREGLFDPIRKSNVVTT